MTVPYDGEYLRDPRERHIIHPPVIRDGIAVIAEEHDIPTARMAAAFGSQGDAEARSGAGEGTDKGEASTVHLADLAGLVPNLTGGLDPAEWLQRQNCDHGDELDRLREAAKRVRDVLDEAQEDEPYAIFSQGGPVWVVDTKAIRQALGEEA